MKGQMESAHVSGRDILVYLPESYDGQTSFPVIYFCAGDSFRMQFEKIMAELEPDVGEKVLPFVGAAILTEDWDNEYTPWPAPGLKKGAPPFGGKADAFLGDVEKFIKPYVDETYCTIPDPAHTTVMGYSLGGLVALYALYKTDLFGCVGSLSGSHWYPDWLSFVQTTPVPNPDASVYFSLGKAEEKSRHPVMRAVGDNTREIYHILELSLHGKLLLEYNEGGHFDNIEERWLNALRWMMQTIV